MRNLWRVIDRPQGRNATLLGPDGPVGGLRLAPIGETAPIQSTMIKTSSVPRRREIECSVAKLGWNQMQRCESGVKVRLQTVSLQAPLRRGFFLSSFLAQNAKRMIWTGRAGRGRLGSGASG